MKTIYTLLCMCFGHILAAQSPTPFDYTIIFGGCFNQDKISIMINEQPVLEHYIVNNDDTAVRGNLSLVQYADGLRINFNRAEQLKEVIPFENELFMTITVNQQITRWNFDLTLGNIIVLEKCAQNESQAGITAEQIREPGIAELSLALKRDFQY